MTDVTIQIINYNTKKYLTDCLDYILKDLKDSGISYKILVLDNASQDDLSDLEEKYKGSNIKFYYSNVNLGFGAGHNFLAKKTEGRYILILNPDLKFIEAKTIERIINYLEKNQENNIVVAGPRLLNEKGVQMWDHGTIDGFLSWFANKIGNSHWRDDKERKEVAWVSGAVFLIRREDFEGAGGFDENFFLYKEEEDLCLRLRKKGRKVIYLPDIKVFHYGSVVASKDKFFVESDRYFLEKHFRKKGVGTYYLIRALNYLKHNFLARFFGWS